MLTTRIAAGATAVVLGISGVALANADLSGEVQTETHTGVSTPAASADLEARTETDATVSISSSTTTEDSTSTTVDDHPSTTTANSTSTTVDGHPGTTTANSTSTTVDDHPGTEGEEHETRAIVSLDLNTYTVGTAGTVTVDGMAIVAVDVNPGWTVEIEEASADRIRIEFENGERDVEFELRVDGELRIKSGN